MSQINFINSLDHLTSRLEEEGKEVKKIASRSRVTMNIISINPLQRLCERGVIDHVLYRTGRRYQRDYELANLSHHARPNFESAITNQNFFPSAREPSQAAINASKNIDTIKDLLIEHDKGNRNRLYLNILYLLIEREMRLNTVAKQLGMHHLTITNKAKEILLILRNYYDY